MDWPVGFDHKATFDGMCYDTTTTIKTTGTTGQNHKGC